MSIRDRESLLRAYERELASAERDKDTKRAEAIRAEIERVKALPHAPAPPSDATPAEREGARVRAYLDALKTERNRAKDSGDTERANAAEAEIARVEAALKGESAVPSAEQARSVPKTERPTAPPA